MIISLILAMGENRGIGWQNDLPWHLPADLQRFKELTMGHHLIMGRRTHQSINEPLPGRINIILTRDLDFHAPGCTIVHSLSQALQVARVNGEEEVFVIGGGEIYAQSLPIADRIYLTIVHARPRSDKYFPELNESVWKMITSQYFPADANNQYATTFKILERLSSQGSISSQNNLNSPVPH